MFLLFLNKKSNCIYLYTLYDKRKYKCTFYITELAKLIFPNYSPEFEVFSITVMFFKISIAKILVKFVTYS